MLIKYTNNHISFTSLSTSLHQLFHKPATSTIAHQHLTFSSLTYHINNVHQHDHILPNFGLIHCL